MTEKEKMLAGELYTASDSELVALRQRARKLTRLYNNTAEDERSQRTEILTELLGSMGKNIFIEPSFKCDYGGNISVGENFYANFDCIILDVCKVTIGDNVKFGPRVCIYTAAHPIDAQTRNSLFEFGKPVVMGSNVWIGGSAVILPGVTIGDNAVIGAGAVVAKDVPAGVVAVGNPCGVVRGIYA
jgi:maltose O-acetyltransferase